MRVRIEGTIDISDEEVIIALESKKFESRDDMRANIEGAEFSVVVDGVKWNLTIHDAEVE